MQKYQIITIGCQMNQSDSQRMAGWLESRGLKPAAGPDRADLVVVNTCGVRQSAEDRAYGLIDRIKKNNPRGIVVLAGCLSHRRDVKKKLKDKVDIWLPIGEFSIFNFQFSNKSQNPNPKTQNCDYLMIRPKYNSKVSAFVPIGNGCDNYCSYCVVPYARGREVYRPASEIIGEARGLIERGYQEINLIAQNVNSYKSPIVINQITNGHQSVNFTKLLKLISEIPGNFRIRFATSHPKDMSQELISLVASGGKICPQLHLPLQSGDNEILSRMNRRYTVEDYKKLISGIREIRQTAAAKKISGHESETNGHESGMNSRALWQPPIAISTDVIVGFPGETREQFKNTLNLFKEIKFDQAYIARYSPRPGTAAAQMADDVSQTEKKRREEELTKVLRRTALENNRKYLGQVVEVLIEGKNRKGEWYGETTTAKNAACQKLDVEDSFGRIVRLKINQARDFGLAGEVINQ